MTKSRTDDILRKVRALIARANSTTFEAERETCLAKADEFMEKYAIELWMLETKQNHSRLIVKKVLDFSWYADLRGLDRDARSEIWSMFNSCVRHCRCVTSWTTVEYTSEGKFITVYGLESDISYLDLLFTDLITQMFSKLRPKYDPALSMGHNIAVAKAAGMKYADIAIWMGREDWVRNGRPIDHGIMARAYKEYAMTNDEDWITMSPKTYQYSYVSAFASRIRTRLADMLKQRDEPTDNHMALVLRDIRDQAMEAFYLDYPEMRPHPSDCKCKECTKKRKPVKYRERQYSYVAGSKGTRAGDDARIVSRDPSLDSRKELPS